MMYEQACSLPVTLVVRITKETIDHDHDHRNIISSSGDHQKVETIIQASPWLRPLPPLAWYDPHHHNHSINSKKNNDNVEDDDDNNSESRNKTSVKLKSM
eukprot:scpid35498/ scgid35201/ 